MAVTISAGVRQNLMSLQNAATMLSETQNKLATGKKVNSALDNPSSFFTASNLNSRASDLNGLMDDMGQSVQVLKAADQGLTSIGKLVDSAKGKATQALQSSDSAARAKYAAEYNEILSQIEGIAKDSGYNGKNLLGGAGNDVTVIFNEDQTNKLNVSAVDYTDSTNLGLSGTVYSASGTAYTAGTTENSSAALVDTEDFVITVDKGNGDTAEFTITQDASMTIKDFTEKVKEATGGLVNASFDEDTRQITFASAFDFTTAAETADTKKDTAGAAASVTFTTDAEINQVLKALTGAQDTLRSQASTFGTNLSVVQTRQDFTKNMINTLQTGADKLTLADMNEEGANLLALQTQQQLSSTALSLASQADQNVLRLIG
ncbi:MAG: flagellar protein [Hyphomicrobiaceae bacterium]|nr:flagellar protein [Hyphomicrobiaceae bacterium]